MIYATVLYNIDSIEGIFPTKVVHTESISQILLDLLPEIRDFVSSFKTIDELILAGEISEGFIGKISSHPVFPEVAYENFEYAKLAEHLQNIKGHNKHNLLVIASSDAPRIKIVETLRQLDYDVDLIDGEN